MELSGLRSRGAEKSILIPECATNGDAHDEPSTPSFKYSANNYWYFIPTSCVLATLLLSTLYMLQVEQAQLQIRDTTIMELKSQIRTLKEQVSMARRNRTQEDSQATAAMTATMRKAEQEVERLRGESFDLNKKLQDMSNRVSQLQVDRGKLNHQLQVANRERRALAKQLGIEVGAEADGKG